MEKNSNEFNFKHKFEGYRLRDVKRPEQAIAYEESLVKKLYEENNLSIDQLRIFPNLKTSQDIIIAVKNFAQ